MNGGVEVRVEGTKVVRLVATPPLAAKVLAGPDGPVLMLVGSAAGLLAGDTVRVRIDLAPGSRLTLRSTSATIAHPCAGERSTTLEVDCRLGEGAQLRWLPEPLIACRGCRHYGRSRLALAAGASATWLDTVALGRTGEHPGRLEQRLDVELDGRPLLREGLCIGPSVAAARLDGIGAGWASAGGAAARIDGVGAGWDGPAVLGPYRHAAALHLLGRRLPSDIPGAMQLAGLGTTVRLVARRGDELATKLAAILPHFLEFSHDPADPAVGRSGLSAKEAVHA